MPVTRTRTRIQQEKREVILEAALDVFSTHGYRGSTDNPKLGRDAVTHVRVLERLAGASLVECRLETGRTHQIRIHLSEAGHPLIGERVYGKSWGGQLIQALGVFGMDKEVQAVAAHS